MALSRVPELTSVRVPIMGEPTNRDGVTTHDQRFVNGYFDILTSTENKKYYFWVKRPGYSQLIQPSGGAATGRGLYSWKGDLYSVWGTQLYKNSTNLGVTLTTSTGRCDFQETRPAAATQYLSINDGQKLYCIAAGTGVVTTITSNFPNPNVGSLEYMDTYLFTMDANGVIYQSNADDPTTWDPTKTITLNMFNGVGRGMGHQNNIIVAFSDRHMQGFWDNANASGSVLNNYEQMAQQIGCVCDSSIQHHESLIYFVSDTHLGGYGIYQLQGLTNLNKISTPGVDRILRQEGNNINSCQSSILRIAGHIFYIVNLISANRTFVFDQDNQMWLEWQASDGVSMMPFVWYTQHNNTAVAQHNTNGWIYTLSENTYQDDGSNFTVFARFSRADMDKVTRKFMNRLDVIGDTQTGTANLMLQYSDDDWATLSTTRTIDMTQTKMVCHTMGQFRRRSYQLSYAGNTPMRLEGLELKFRMHP